MLKSPVSSDAVFILGLVGRSRFVLPVFAAFYGFRFAVSALFLPETATKTP